MLQSRLGSFIEATMNTAIGLGINLAAQRVVFPLFGFDPNFGTNLAIAAIFTVISIARGYIVRRFFNFRLQRAAERLARAVG
jgi:hypothetical protein